MRLTILYLALLLPFRSSGQAKAPALDKEQIQEECGRVLPLSGKVLVPAAKGGWVTCECTDLRSRTFQELDSLRHARDMFLLRRASKLPKVVDPPPLIGRPIYQRVGGMPDVFIAQDTSVTLKLHATCPQELMLTRIVARLATLPGYSAPALHRFVFVVNNADDPSISIDHGTEISTVFIPRTVLFSPHMTEELFVFLLLHEMGHDLYVGENTEFNADRWAVTEGLPAYYGSELAPAMIPIVVADFHRYREASYSAQTLEYPSCTPDKVGAYPTQTCRLQGIEHGQWEGYVVGNTFGYPDYCWSYEGGECGAIAKPANERPIEGCCACEPPDPCPCAVTWAHNGTCAVRQCEIQVRVDDLCKRQPSTCGKLRSELVATELQAAINSGTTRKRLSRSSDLKQREIERFVQRLAKTP